MEPSRVAYAIGGIGEFIGGIAAYQMQQDEDNRQLAALELDLAGYAEWTTDLVLLAIADERSAGGNFILLPTRNRQDAIRVLGLFVMQRERVKLSEVRVQDLLEESFKEVEK